MPPLFSRSCEYALQAMLYLARESKGHPIHLHEISTALNAPYHFLSKVLQTLAHNGFVVSYKGQDGGFALSRSAAEIFLLDIVCAIDGEAFLDGCVLGFSKCDDKTPCLVHNSWKEARETVQNMLRSKTIAKLSSKLEPKLTFIDQLSH